MSSGTPLVLDLFADTAGRHPERVAVDAVDGTLTFARLDERAHTVAAALGDRGVRPGDTVAVRVRRRTALVVLMIGVWRAGAAFVLIDPEEPVDVAQYKADLVGARLTVRDEDVPALLAGPPRRAAVPEPGPGDLAYTIFTSGSTGRPKGVETEHGGLAHHVATQLTEIYSVLPDPDRPRRVGGAAPVTFDSFLDQVLPTVAFGHTFVLFDEAGRFDPANFLDLGERSLDVVDCAPSQLSVLVRHGLLERRRPVELVVFGGDKPSADLWTRLRSAGTPAFSIYGATECSIGSMTADVRDFDAVTLGRPAEHSPVYVLDDALLPVGPGAVGEIFLGGPGVGRGYVAAAEETARSFLPDPFAAVTRSDARMYRTGDLGRLGDDGVIEFVGRIDYQVKVRGFRIEPAEVEHALESIGSVTHAAVVPDVLDGPASQLVAFVTPLDGPGWASLRETLSERVASHMVPASGYRLDALPLTPSGKVDRRALLARYHEELAASSALEPPATEAEAAVLSAWKEVLGRDEVGVTDRFAEIGGHSLAAIEIISRLQESWPATFKVADALLAPTVRDMARVLESARAGSLPRRV
ncbi:hypothetical protein DNL40_11860 [Xylanimonas oleitrophica]|uniref:Carrier domain-containing protein n=1 Tax=Xylanimonas oleitrophica TaxID=2607479 RepID=A0A2W5WVQ5_9MICO|nr:non-ribosomal peptide synthetase [Xylanimonas oleitrophica]PZR52366.1 hypothetical protein DNL40_11860 [Xylanimonas oleitrophica]